MSGVNYHLSIKIFSRGKGASAVAKAAYRAAELIKSEYSGESHDYTRKSGVIHKEILLPDHAPQKYKDRSVLWNAVEMGESNRNAQLAREIEVSLPRALSQEQNLALAREFVQKTFADKGMCADMCIHDKGDGNPHAHIMLTLRPLDENGAWAAKSQKEYMLDDNGERILLPSGAFKTRKINMVDWNDQDKAEEWREAWADILNKHLAQNGIDERVDHRSYERQGIEQIPTIHLGVAASQMERKGIRTERGNINREIEISNKEIRQLRARINKLSDWLKKEAANTKPPTLSNVISNVLSRREKSSLTNLHDGVRIHIFLVANNITDFEGLESYVSTMHGKVQSVTNKLKPIERRLKTLDEHISNGENFRAYRKFKKRYDELYSQYESARKETGFFAERKAQKALDAANGYYESNRMEMTLYDSAERYLRDVLQERFDPKKLPPITKWKEEQEMKTAEKKRLYAKYYALKDETQEVEKIKRSIADILHSEVKTQRPMREQEIEI